MIRKKKLIWWESVPVAVGAEQSRVRGSEEESGRRRPAGSPYYGPVTIPFDADADVMGVAG